MVSVIIVAYNIEMCIENSIKSVLSQTYPDLELIIVDDGSSDATGEICQRYQKTDARVMYIKKKNEGQGIARTIGYQVAKGEYVSFLDGDDWLEKDALEKMRKAAQETNADIVVGDIWYVYKKNGGFEKKYSKIRYQDMQIIKKGEALGKISKLRTFTWGKLYKRNFLLEEGFSQASHAYEDTATIPLLIQHANKIVYINVPVYNYYKNRAESTIYRKEKATDLLIALRKLYDSFINEGNFPCIQNELMRLFWGQIRSLFIAHSVSWEIVFENENDYKQLIDYMKEVFSSFEFLQDKQIYVYNSKLAYKALCSLLLDERNIQCKEDNSVSRIVMNEGKYEYKLPQKYSSSVFDENDIWDCADELFFILMV